MSSFMDEYFIEEYSNSPITKEEFINIYNKLTNENQSPYNIKRTLSLISGKTFYEIDYCISKWCLNKESK